MICRCCRLAPAALGDLFCPDCGERAAMLEFDAGLSRDEAEARTVESYAPVKVTVGRGGQIHIEELL